MKYYFIAGTFLVSLSAFALEQSHPVTVKKDGDRIVITITGEAAAHLYESLDVPASRSFGFFQVGSKKTENVECQVTTMGDIPGRTSGSYVCTVTERAQ